MSTTSETRTGEWLDHWDPENEETWDRRLAWPRTRGTRVPTRRIAPGQKKQRDETPKGSSLEIGAFLKRGGISNDDRRDRDRDRRRNRHDHRHRRRRRSRDHRRRHRRPGDALQLRSHEEDARRASHR